MDNITWQAIRELRATPTGGAASDDERRKTFAAALRQAEELADAAKVVGYAAKPLPLFYSLSQAGRAIAAAHLPSDWMLHHHGIGFDSPASTSFLTNQVTPSYRTKKIGSFGGVLAAIGSPRLIGAATLGELWAANPDLNSVAIPTSAGRHMRPLEIALHTPSLVRYDSALLRNLESKSFDGNGELEVSAQASPGVTRSEMESIPQNYPTLRNTVIYNYVNYSESSVVNLKIDIPSPITFGDFWRRERNLISMLEIDDNGPTGSGVTIKGYALPGIAGGESPLPLMLWWALLIGLSSLARYHPAIWTAAIDRDSSELAVPLERVLDVAQERVPKRILESLIGNNDPDSLLAQAVIY